MRAIGDHIIVKAEGGNEVSASGLILGDSVKEKFSRGLVVACGDVESDLKVGDVIVYENRGAVPFKDNGESYQNVNLSSVHIIVD